MAPDLGPPGSLTLQPHTAGTSSNDHTLQPHLRSSLHPLSRFLFVLRSKDLPYTSFGVLIFRDHRDNCTDGGTEEAYRISVETASGCSGSKHLFVVVHFQDTALVLLLVQARSCSDFIVAPWRTTKSCPKLSALLAYSRKCILNPGNYRFEESNAAAKRQRLARAIAHN